MKVTETKLKGRNIMGRTIFEDKRGYFFESFNENRFKEVKDLGLDYVQDNQSYSTFGALGGLHLQMGKFDQANLVRVLKGVLLNIAVDLRKKSSTFGQHEAVELSEANKKQLFIQRGFAHGFLMQRKEAHFF